jgi:hypothetical protein
VFGWRQRGRVSDAGAGPLAHDVGERDAGRPASKCVDRSPSLGDASGVVTRLGDMRDNRHDSGAHERSPQPVVLGSDQQPAWL